MKSQFAIAATLFLLCATAPQAGSRPAFYEELDKIDDVNPYVIKSIIIEGNKLIPRGQIKAVIKTKPGDFYHRKDVEEDLKQIYKLGYFDGKQMHVEAEMTAAGMIIHIKLKENAFLKSITFSGNTIVPTEKMQEMVKTQLQKPVSLTQLAASLRAIEGLYKNEGYLLAKASLGKEEKEGVLPVIIDEGKLQDVRFTGLNDEQKQAVKEVLTVKAGSLYNEKQLTNDLKEAVKTGKVEDLQRQVDRSKKTGGYILTISAVPKAAEAAPQDAASSLLHSGKPKAPLPVLNRLVKSNMYKTIK